MAAAPAIVLVAELELAKNTPGIAPPDAPAVVGADRLRVSALPETVPNVPGPDDGDPGGRNVRGAVERDVAVHDIEPRRQRQVDRAVDGDAVIVAGAEGVGAGRQVLRRARGGGGVGQRGLQRRVAQIGVPEWFRTRG